MKYRKAIASDVPNLCAIERAQPMCAQWDDTAWYNELTVVSSYVLCAEEEDKVVGFSALRLAGGVCEILNIAVDPAWCRRGIGTQLLEQMLFWVRKQQGQSVTLEVHAANFPAQRLYQKAGFTQVGVRKNFYHGKEDAIIMGLKL